MKTEITQKGVTTILSNSLLEPPVKIKNKPHKSYKFDVMSLYYDGVYYFPKDIKPANSGRYGSLRDLTATPYEIQGVYYQGKWYQDTFFITEEFKTLLEQSA